MLCILHWVVVAKSWAMGPPLRGSGTFVPRFCAVAEKLVQSSEEAEKLVLCKEMGSARVKVARDLGAEWRRSGEAKEKHCEKKQPTMNN